MILFIFFQMAVINIAFTSVKQDRRWNAERPSATLDP